MKRLFIAIYILTVLDAICTATGVSQGVIEEGNPLVQMVMQSHPILTAVAVCLAIGGILYGIYRVRNRIKWLPYALGAVCAVKIGIMAMHVVWITQAI